MKDVEVSPHGWGTRLNHMLVAIAVTIQITTSLFMTAHPNNGKEDVFFEVHEYSGLASFAIILVFWLVVVFRNTGTDVGAIFPWFQPHRRARVWASAKTYLIEAKKLKLRGFTHDDPLASAVHGLGMVIVSIMATTGLAYYAAILAGHQEGTIAAIALSIHEPMSKLVWAYLVGHAGFAILHAWRSERSLSVMWTFRR